ncbi:MAG: efflux RND transporter periplasmic adaptor subunit [Rhodobacteraceae bacterium]|nr:MAG: efflux RND transporter periplasmic adaptor subunit [Paracoccaceae bacterium]
MGVFRLFRLRGRPVSGRKRCDIPSRNLIYVTAPNRSGEPMTGLIRQVVVILVLAAAGVGGFKLWEDREAAAVEPTRRARPAPGVVVARAEAGQVERVVSAVGAARPVASVELAALSDGRVVERGFEGGERVEEGAVLLRLDERAARADLVEAEADHERASAALARAQTLLTQGSISESALDSARAEMARAEAARARARIALDERVVLAPFSGVTGFPAVDVGAVVRANTVIGTLDDLSALDVDFSVPERFFGDVAVGARVRATSASAPGEALEGSLTALSRRLDPTTRAFTARARIPNPGGRVPAGAFLRVTLVLADRDGVTVPEEAVALEGGAAVVYVVEDDRARRRAVTLGARSPGRVEVVEGVAEGEAVVVRGVQIVSDGAPVRVLEEEGAPPAPGA